MRSRSSATTKLLETDTAQLHAAAYAYAKALVAHRQAWDAHQSNRILDEFDQRSAKTETTLFYAEKEKEAMRSALCHAALMFAGSDAAVIGKRFKKAVATT